MRHPMKGMIGKIFLSSFVVFSLIYLVIDNLEVKRILIQRNHVLHIAVRTQHGNSEQYLKQQNLSSHRKLLDSSGSGNSSKLITKSAESYFNPTWQSTKAAYLDSHHDRSGSNLGDDATTRAASQKYATQKVGDRKLQSNHITTKPEYKGSDFNKILPKIASNQTSVTPIRTKGVYNEGKSHTVSTQLPKISTPPTLPVTQALHKNEDEAQINDTRFEPEDNGTSNVTSFFHTVTSLRASRDLQLVATGTRDFPRDVSTWLAGMQRRYAQLFKRENAQFEDYYLNATLSETLPILREIPDQRLAQCHQRFEGAREEQDLPKVSIIIPFHNEQYSFLVRTLHSVLDKTPASLVHEILLIDDASDKENLRVAFPAYVRSLPRVRLYRSHERQGLIRARLLGALMASAPVLVFLDAHIECQPHWLQPLLHIVAENASAIAIPATGYIDPYTLQFEKLVGGAKHGDARSISGMFDWELNYVWTVEAYPDERQSPLRPVPTATIIGCAMVVGRETFFRQGAFDEDMYIWGGENLEISFRTWMCGGSVQLAPCAIVGHVFREYLPYAFPQRDQVHVNLQRVADVWMDEYAAVYYQTAHEPFALSPQEARTLETRKQLRANLQCKSFKWYLQNVATKVIPPELGDVYFGTLESIHGCMTLLPSVLGIYPCVYHHSSQHFALSSNGVLRSHNGSCLVHNTKLHEVDFRDCNADHPTSTWMFNEGYLFRDHEDTRYCIGHAANPGGASQYSIIIKPCETDTNFLWKFRHVTLQ